MDRRPVASAEVLRVMVMYVNSMQEAATTGRRRLRALTTLLLPASVSGSRVPHLGPAQEVQPLGPVLLAAVLAVSVCLQVCHTGRE